MNESPGLDKILVCPISVFGPTAMFSLYKTHNPVIEAHENYQKRSMRNRTYVLTANGPMNLSIPLRKGKTNTAIREVKISYAENWIKNYLQAIRSAYANAPYFDFYYPAVESIMKKEHNLLFELAQESLEYLLKELSLPRPDISSEYNPDYPGAIDLRKHNVSDYIRLKPYVQVFSDRHRFINGLSILDALFNLGPETNTYLSDFEMIKR